MALVSVEGRGRKDWAKYEVGLQCRPNNSLSLPHGKAIELEELFSVVLSWEGMTSLYTPVRISHRMGEATGRDLTLGEVASQLRQAL